MKRFLCICLVFALMLSISAPAWAEEAAKEYRFEELGLSLSIPSQFVAITREDVSNYDFFQKTNGTDLSEFLEYMQENYIILQAMEEDLYHELTIITFEGEMFDMESITEEDLLVINEYVVEDFKEEGIETSGYKLYQHSQKNFLQQDMTATKDGYTMYSRQYTTTTDSGFTVILMMYCFSGSSGDDCHSTLRQIVDSMQFDSALNTPQADSDPASRYTYTDMLTQTSFEVPENWVVYSREIEEDKTRTIFISTEDIDEEIIYVSFNVWPDWPGRLYMKGSRADINNSLFSPKIYAESLDIPEEDVTKVKYGDNEFYFVDLKSYITEEEMPGRNVMIQLAYNGHMHSFQYIGSGDEQFYQDFEQIVSSLELGSKTAEDWMKAFANKDLAATAVDIVLTTALSITLPQLTVLL